MRTVQSLLSMPETDLNGSRVNNEKPESVIEFQSGNFLNSTFVTAEDRFDDFKDHKISAKSTQPRATTSVSSAEGESGFSSLSSFQEVTILKIVQ